LSLSVHGGIWRFERECWRCTICQLATLQGVLLTYPPLRGSTDIGAVGWTPYIGDLHVSDLLRTESGSGTDLPGKTGGMAPYGRPGVTRFGVLDCQPCLCAANTTELTKQAIDHRKHCMEIVRVEGLHMVFEREGQVA